MKVRRAKEADVREEVAAPFLAALGYRRGTPNDISREMNLTYEKQFLGRKKETDPPLRGRADYVLSVLGAGRWVLETKAPTEAIDRDAIEQAMSYARHPEIAATYAVILNGEQLTVHHTSQPSTAPPLAVLAISDPDTLAEELSGLLSPAAIRRDCSPPIVDLRRPIADGLRSSAAIRGGEVHHHAFTWKCNFALPAENASNMDEMARRLTGLKIPITGGEVSRDNNSRIRAKLAWAMPHDEMLRFALDKGLMDAEYLALDNVISTNPSSPTVFDFVSKVVVNEGDTLFDQLQWNTIQVGIDMTMNYSGRATGYIQNFAFQGVFAAHYLCTFPAVPDIELEMETQGAFRVELDAR